MKIVAFVVVLVLLGAGVIFFTGEPESIVEKHRCPDGRMVQDPAECEQAGAETHEPQPSHDVTRNDTGLNRIGETAVVSGQGDVEEAFEEFAQQEGQDYRYVSSSVFRETGDVTYYQVVYRHNRVSGGKDSLIIDSEGQVYEQEVLI